jgi:hypothetical protein
MIAIVTVLFAFPLGFFLRHRLVAATTYATIYLWSFTFQTAYLTRAWVGGDHSAFAQQPDAGAPYGLVTGAIFLVGFGLVALGHRLGSRRRTRRSAVDLDTATRSF